MASIESAIAQVTGRGAALVDQCRIDAHVPHPAHQLSGRRTADRRQVVAGMPQIVDVDPRQA
jgi:hypothetical protein